jgi:D-inositol-3-phosphate glycosyltransferase
MLRKIALISDHASPLAAAGGVDSGGQNVYVAQIARNLAALGYAVDVFTRRDAADQPEVVQWDRGVRVVHVPAGPAGFVRKEELLPLMEDFSAYVCSFCRRAGGYDLVHANFFMSGLVAIKLKQRFDIPFVVTFHALGRVRRQHQGDADQFPVERLAVEDAIVAEADAIVAECPQDKADLVSLYRADPRKIAVVPCGFDAGEFWPIARRFARRTLGLAADERVVVNIGRMVPRKGVDNAIRGVARLARDLGVRARLLVVGGNSDLPDPALTPEIGRLRAIAEDERVAERVTFTGRRSRELLKLYYSAADVFVTTPWYEPFGITPLEAMACGRPVVATAVGGLQDSVVDGVTGDLVPPRDPDALGQALAALLDDDERRAAYGAAGVRRARDRYRWSRVVADTEAVYRHVLAHRRPVEVAR